MDEIFIKKVRAAAAAGWWTVLIFYCILLIQWFAYWVIMNKQPDGMLCIWGKGFTWVEIRTIWLCQKCLRSVVITFPLHSFRKLSFAVTRFNLYRMRPCSTLAF